MIEKDQDPAMTYENIVRHAFNCGKYEDPLCLGHQEVYNFGISDNLEFELKLGISYSLYKLSIDLDAEALKALSEKVWAAVDQEMLLEIMTESIDIVNNK
jgi:hypothetical protein